MVALKNFFNAVAKMFKSDPNKIRDTGYTRLQTAIADNDLASVVALIKMGADVNYRGSLMYPPLHLALEQDRHSIAVALIQGGADVNLPDASGKTPLHRAAMQSQETFVRTLLKLGADPNMKDDNGKTPLHLVSTAQPDLISLLVANRARINEKDNSGNTPLHTFLDKAPMVEELLKNGADPNVKNDFGVSPYMMMLEDERIKQYPKVLQQLLAYKADIGSTNALGETVLHMAARLEMQDTFNTVIDDCELRVKDANGNNVLHALARTQNVSMIQRVIAKAPDLLHDENASGRTPLAELARRAERMPYQMDDKFITAARVMINAGADPSVQDENGRSLLHYAVAQDRQTFIEFLFARKIDPDLTDRDGKAALHVAIDKKNLTVLDRLLDLGADPDLTDARGWTVLDRLAEKNDRNSPIVQRLIVAGGSYEKQLPLNPELMRKRRPGLDKSTIEKGDDKTRLAGGFGVPRNPKFPPPGMV